MKLRQRGIALIISLIVTSLLILLTGAFLKINSSYLQTTRAQQLQRNVEATSSGVFAYALYKLEHDRTWGKGGFDANGPETDTEFGGKEEYLTVNYERGSNVFSGTFPSRNTEFRATIENNLEETGTSPTGVPPSSARVTIDCQAGGLEKQVTALVRVAPLFDSSAISRKNLLIDAESLSIESLDPFRNTVRAEEQVQIPDALSGGRTKFRNPSNGQADSKGMLVTKGEIQSGGTTLSNSNLARANANSGGRFYPQAESHFEVHDLAPEDITVPGNAIELKSGVYKFTKARADITFTAYASERPGGHGGLTNQKTSQEIDVLEYYADPEREEKGLPPDRVFRAEDRSDDIDLSRVTLRGGKGKGSGPARSAEVNDVKINYGHGGVVKDVTIGDTVAITESGSSVVMADLLNQKINIPSGTTVETDGDLIITSNQGTPPVLDLGDPSDPPALVANGGSLKLERAITHGVGSLIAKEGDVSLVPLTNNLTVNTSSKTKGLVVYAKGDVEMRNAHQGGDWSFNGLIYARERFLFHANGANINLNGSLVSLNGDIDIRNAQDVRLLYNPKHLEAVAQTLPLNRLQIERVNWRE